MKGQPSFQMGMLDLKRKLEALEARNLKTFYAKYSFSDIFHSRKTKYCVCILCGHIYTYTEAHYPIQQSSFNSISMYSPVYLYFGKLT